MTGPNQSLSPLQAEILRQILNEANGQIGPALQMILNQVAENLEVHTSMVPLSEVGAIFGDEPLVTIKIAFEGDIKGVFLLLQPQSHGAGSRTLLNQLFSGEASGEKDAAAYMRQDWIRPNRGGRPLSDERIQEALGELGNVLFGAYLMAIYRKCALATFQESPRVMLPDQSQSLLRDALDYYGGQTQTAFVAEVSAVLAKNKLRFWLLMMAEPAGFRAILDGLKKDQ